MKSIRNLLVACAVSACIPLPTRAEVSEVNFATLYGVATLPMIVMEREKLVEKRAAQAGLGPVQVNWRTVGGSTLLNDGLISGRLQFIGVGATPLITLWDKTGGRVKGLAAMATYPLYLNVRNPKLRSIADFTDKDKIALPSVKVSTQAIMLQMAAANAFGMKNFARLDPLTVSMSHPDAAIALANAANGVTAHFTASPYNEEELRIPGVRTLLTSYEILGGPATAAVMATTAKFREDNPKIYLAVYQAVGDAIDIINKDKLAAAKLYVAYAKDAKSTPEAVNSMISSPDYFFELTPRKVFKTALFMHDIGSVNNKPTSWKDFFFPEVHGLTGD